VTGGNSPSKEDPVAMTFAQLVTKILRDARFRRALRRSPRRALERAGVKPTAQMLKALKAFNWRAARRVANAFGPKGFGTYRIT
jgi:hypothetical protein